MLAFMPQPQPLPDYHTPTTMATSTMSIPLLPSAPMPFNKQSLAPIPLQAPSPSKRPKLSLNTANVAPVIGKGSTSLRLETLSATSPTARNTFRNTRNPDRISSARSRQPAISPLATWSNPSTPIELPTPSRVELPESGATSPATSITSDSTTVSLPSEAPYKLSFNTISILRNGPVQRTKSHRSPFSQARPMFPPAKKVVFRAQLEEEIKTAKYTLRHSDIEASLSPFDEDDTQNASDDQHDEAATDDIERTAGHSPPASSKDNQIAEEEDSDSCPATPVAGKRKRDRQWIWTLAPAQPASQDVRQGQTDLERDEQ